MSLLENKVLQARVASVRTERERTRARARKRDIERERGEGGSRGEVEGGVTLWGGEGGGGGFEGGLLAEEDDDEEEEEGEGVGTPPPPGLRPGDKGYWQMRARQAGAISCGIQVLLCFTTSKAQILICRCEQGRQGSTCASSMLSTGTCGSSIRNLW